MTDDEKRLGEIEARNVKGGYDNYADPHLEFKDRTWLISRLRALTATLSEDAQRVVEDANDALKDMDCYDGNPRPKIQLALTLLSRILRRVAELDSKLPETFYAGLPLETRLANMVEEWRRAIIANQELERDSVPPNLPALPMTNELTVILLPDDGYVQAEKDVENLKDGSSIMTFKSEDSGYFHKLRLLTSIDPTLIKRISVFYLQDGKYKPVGLSFEDENKWPPGFCMMLWKNEIAIAEVRRPSLKEHRVKTETRIEKLERENERLRAENEKLKEGK